MIPEPRHCEDYSARQVEAARRVLVDIGQVLAAFKDSMVVIGGWVPDLLLPDADEPHIGSIDVDLALDVAKLGDGRYAELLKLLLDTGRYRQGLKDFQLVATVDLGDGERPVEVELDFLASQEVKLRGKKRIENFRVLQADGCASAFNAPEQIELPGKMIKGAINIVTLRVASVADFLVMKAHALGGRDKPKDAYDLCYCLEHFPNGMDALAQSWKSRRAENDVVNAISILRRKFTSVQAFGPQQVAEFYDAQDAEINAMHARRAFELVGRFLTLVEELPPK